VMRARAAEDWYARQRTILIELVEALSGRAPDCLDPMFAPMWKAAGDDAARLRVVIDQVASLTDPAAVAWHRTLVAGGS
jgi:dGTPase